MQHVSGNKIRLADIVKAMEGADVVLLGETHDDRIAHLLQLQLLRGAQQRFSRHGNRLMEPLTGSMAHKLYLINWAFCRTDRPVALSLEMFERDVQGIMDEYLSGAITERDLRQVHHADCAIAMLCSVSSIYS